MKQYCFTLILLHLALFCCSQENSTNALNYEVNTVYPPLSIAKETLKNAHSIIDLNKHYKPSWIREYISVEVLTTSQGSLKKAITINDTLSQEQKNIMNMADVGTEIEVKVLYIPENKLADNDAKEIDFAFIVNPEEEAKYVGGQQQLEQFLNDNAINKIPEGTFEGYALTAIKFTIDELGQVIEPFIYWPSENEYIDELLLETISKMPNWKAAEYANGIKVKQDFVLTVGNHENCAIHTLNIAKGK